MTRAAAALCLLTVAACARSAPGGGAQDGAPVLARGTPGAASAVAQASGSATAAAEAPLGDWVDLVRLHRYKDAAKALDALDEKERARGEVRYVRARVAAELGDHARAVKELTDLEALVPLIASDIADARAASALEAGPFELAAKYYAARDDAQSLMSAARAFNRAGDAARAKAAANSAVVAAARQSKKKKEPEARARLLRAELAEKRGDKALASADLAWVAVNAPTLGDASDVDHRLAKIAPQRALSANERYERAMALAWDGNVDRTQHELDALAKANGKAPSKAAQLRALGLAHYASRKNYGQAAELLEQAAKLGGEHAPECLYYAARAHSRAHRDDRAQKLYGEVARRFPKTYWAQQAAYLGPRLDYIGGKWSRAIAGYETYLKRYAKRGSYASTVRYELAVSVLAAGQYARAVKELDRLADAEDKDREESRLRELQAVALAGAGDKKRAAALFREVIEERPLSFAALAAASRLSQLGEAPPMPIKPAKAAAQRAPLAVQLPPKAKLFVRVGLDAEAEGEIERAEAAIQKAHAPRGDEALCRAYGQLSLASRRYRVGQRAARWSQLEHAPSADSRWLWECIYPRPYETMVRDAEREWKLPTDLVYAVMRQESAFRPTVVSPAKAVGLMQLIPPTAENVAKEIGIDYDPLDLLSPPTNIRMGAYYLHKVLGTFGGNVALAAAAYNAGPSAVSRWLESGDGLPLDLWVARIPYAETRGYVTRVVGNVARYAYLSGGESAVPKLELELPKGLRAPPDAY